MAEPLFTPEDVEWIDSLRGYLVDDDWQFAVGLRLRLQQWIDQQVIWDRPVRGQPPYYTDAALAQSQIAIDTTKLDKADGSEG